MVQAGWPGRIIDGRYAVESVIGAGGMGLVLKAHHKFTGAEVALKVLKPELELDPEIQMRFLDEARAPNAIGHPGIVSVLDAGKAPDGLLYLVMELLVGRQLRIPMARGELRPGDVRRIMIELFDVLGAAHSRGFVHRDLKPENVFLAGPSASVKLLDFGIAKVLDGGLSRARTAAGATLGTPAYMAPEQFHDPSGVDARADLWAAGVMTFEMLAGRLPFRADTTEAMLIAIATREPDPIRVHVPNAPPALEAFFARALCRDRAGRFATAIEMAQAFAALPLGTAVSPTPARATPLPLAVHARAATPLPFATPAPVPAGSLTMATAAPTGPGTMATAAPTGPGTMAAMATGPTGWATPHPGASASASAPAASAFIPAASASAPAMVGAVRPPTAPPVEAAGTSKRAWVLGLGLASVVSIVVIVIAVKATRKQAPSGAQSGSATGSAIVALGSGSASSPGTALAPPSDAAVAESSPDAAAFDAITAARLAGLLHDAGSGSGKHSPPGTHPNPNTKPVTPPGTNPNAKTVTPPGTNPNTKPVTPVGTAPPPVVETEASIAAECKTSCQSAKSSCYNVSARCEADCRANRDLRGCLKPPYKSCNQMAMCGMRAVCGSEVLRGAGTCRAAATCQKDTCNGNNAIKCGCSCAMKMSPINAHALSALDACAMNCGLDETCIQNKCMVQITTCAAQ